jgi:hypothetical protein
VRGGDGDRGRTAARRWRNPRGSRGSGTSASRSSRRPPALTPRWADRCRGTVRAGRADGFTRPAAEQAHAARVHVAHQVLRGVGVAVEGLRDVDLEERVHVGELADGRVVFACTNVAETGVSVGGLAEERLVVGPSRRAAAPVGAERGQVALGQACCESPCGCVCAGAGPWRQAAIRVPEDLLAETGIAPSVASSRFSPFGPTDGPPNWEDSSP